MTNTLTMAKGELTVHSSVAAARCERGADFQPCFEPCGLNRRTGVNDE
jgi:hypothetical protein